MPYSALLNINLKTGKNDEILKWFLASLLYSKPIRESSATKTYKCFERFGVITSKRIIQAGRKRLISILDEGGYARYDFNTSSKLIEAFRNLDERYSGNFNKLYERSNNGEELECKIKELAEGIGDTTVSILLRDMQSIWKKAHPEPTSLVKMAMEDLEIKNLADCSKKNNIDIIWLETVLLRYAKNFLKKGKKLAETNTVRGV